MTLLDLPAELWTLVIKQLEEDGAQRAIAALSETCRLCHQLLQPILFSKPELSSPRSWHRYAVVWKQRINPFTLAGGRVDVPEMIKPTELSFELKRDEGRLPASIPFLEHRESRRNPPCALPDCPSYYHTTIDRCPVPLTLLGANLHGFLNKLNSLSFKNCRVPEQLLVELLGPSSTLRSRLDDLAMVNIGDNYEAAMVIFELWRFRCLWAATSDEIEELQEEDPEIEDFPRGNDGGVTPAFSALAMRDFATFRSLRCELSEDGIYSVRVAREPPSPNPFAHLTSLDLSLHSGGIEIPVIFGAPSYPSLKKLKLRTSAYSFFTLCRADYALMLRSVAPDFAKIKKPWVALRSAPRRPSNQPQWDSLEGNWHTEDIKFVLSHYRGPSLDLLDLSAVQLYWYGDDNW